MAILTVYLEAEPCHCQKSYVILMRNGNDCAVSKVLSKGLLDQMWGVCTKYKVYIENVGCEDIMRKYVGCIKIIFM